MTEVSDLAGCWVDFRTTTDLSERYVLSIFADSIRLSKESFGIEKRSIVSSLSEWSGWNEIRIEAYGANLKVYVNRFLKINFTDFEPFEEGGINFRVDSRYAEIFLDDVIVTSAK